MPILPRLFAAALILGAAMPAAHAQSVGDITVEAPWSRATPPGARVGVGYLTIRNAGAEPDRLTDVRTDRAQGAEIHSMSISDGVMEMEPVAEGLEIPAEGTASLEPGSYHLMLIGLAEPLAEGESVPVVLTFKRAGEVEVALAVGSIGARGPATAEQSGGGGATGAHAGH